MHEESVRAQGLRKRHPARVACRPRDHDECQAWICVVHIAPVPCQTFPAAEVHLRGFTHELARVTADRLNQPSGPSVRRGRRECANHSEGLACSSGIHLICR
jgi:hypothetical protein